MTTRTTFGQWLKERRQQLDLTREELAQKIGCAAVTLYKIEVGERRPSKQIARLLAEHLHIPPQDHAAFIDFARGGLQHASTTALWGTSFHPPTNLPLPLTPLVGRDEEVAHLRRRLLQPETRLVTLVGPPGIGKTRLAMQAASTVLDDFSDGVFWVALAPISDASLVLTTIATTLGLYEGGSQIPLQRLKISLRDQKLLLVLDNFEQILGAASQIADLLAACPWLKVLVTSRAPLRIRPERQMPVPPLALPHPARLPPVDELTHYSAISLFVDRAQAVKPDFALTPSNASAVAAICARLDGLPLAIELISARVKLLPPAALLERLHGPLLLRSDGLRDLDPRHRTLNAAIDWSYRLLNAGEQTLFRRLGIFVGGWTMEAAEAVCLQNLNLSLMDGLAALLDNNLIKQETQSDGEARFTMLETIREYALEQLAASRELELLEQRHAHYYLTFAAEVEARPKNAQRWGLEWDQLDRELPNFRAALAWFKKRGENETLLRLALSLNDLWLGRGHLTEGRTWLTDGLAGMQPAGPTALSVDDYKSLRSTALNKVGLIHQWQGNLDAALPYHEESVALCRELGDRAGLATALGFYGMLFVLREDVEQAGPLLQEALALWRALNNLHGISQITFYLGALAYVEGNLYLADQYWSESLDGMYAVGDMWVAATIAAHHAMIALDRGEYELAHARLVESLTLLQDLGEQWQIVHTLEVSACLAVFRGQESAEPHAYLLRAARIFGAAEKLRETLDAPVLSFQRRSYERGLAALRAQLEEPVLQVAWGEGRKMTLEQAVEQALVE